MATVGVLNCAEEGCVKPVLARAMCSMHYARWRKANPGLTRPMRYGAGTIETLNGYLRTWEPTHPLAKSDGYVLAHRKAWFDANGPIPDGFHVHHRNGVKTDNRIENLELKSAAQHRREHISAEGFVTNQYGTFPAYQHPSLAAYQRGCRCDECRGLNAKRERDRKARLRGPSAESLS